jgi:transcriptional regulator with XRE-family HTH domain
MRHFEPYPLGYFKIDWKRFGELVRIAREANKMSQREFAEATGISAATICRCENGYSVDPDHFFTLLQVIGLPFELPEELTKPA